MRFTIFQYAEEVCTSTITEPEDDTCSLLETDQGAGSVDLHVDQNVETELTPEIQKCLEEELRTTKEDDKEEETLTMQIWDFAGHELYYTTHQVN